MSKPRFYQTSLFEWTKKQRRDQRISPSIYLFFVCAENSCGNKSNRACFRHLIVFFLSPLEVLVMNDGRCSSHRSLSTVHKWLLEGGDGSLSIGYRSTRRGKVKRKRLQLNKERSRKSLIDWLYTCVKEIFTVDEQRSIRSSSLQDEISDPYRSFYEILFPSLQSDSSSISTADLLSSPPTSKSTQTRPIFCFELRDGQTMSSLRCSTIPTKEATTSTSSCPLTRTYHFDQRNCLVECRHSSDDDQQTDTESCHAAPEVIFAQSTCKLIRQAWSAPSRA